MGYPAYQIRIGGFQYISYDWMLKYVFQFLQIWASLYVSAVKSTWKNKMTHQNTNIYE